MTKWGEELLEVEHDSEQHDSQSDDPPQDPNNSTTELNNHTVDE